MSGSPYTKNVYSGKFMPTRPEKYRGDVSNIVYRSGLELRFMKWLDSQTHVLSWSSEEVVIPYVHPKDNRLHRYFMDFQMKVQKKDGSVKTYLIEVKPHRFTQEPVVPKRKSKRFLTEVIQWAVNQSKWKAAREYAKDRGWDFMLITERDLGSL